MMNYANYAIIIPALNPDQKMTKFVDALVNEGYQNIILVNDGSSSPEAAVCFEKAAEYPQVRVLTHEVNRGKGAALKTAFGFLAEHGQGIKAAITADADGQHNLASLSRCAQAYEENPGSVIFGGREFSDKNIPFRSRFGNKVSSVVYRFSCGIKLQDTQTGLRVVPAEYFEKFSTLKGDRYEYETQMIIAVKELNIPYHEVAIETIYIDDNESSHFNPIKDSLRIYRIVLAYFVKFLFSSLTSWVVDIGVYWITMSICVASWHLQDSIEESVSLASALINHTWNHHIAAVLIATLTSRVISSIVNFILNRKVVFKDVADVRKTAVKYFTLALCQMILSFLLVDLLANGLLHVTGFLNVLIKCIVDMCLFVFSYGIQRKWVFKNKKI